LHPVAGKGNSTGSGKANKGYSGKDKAKIEKEANGILAR
jgi:hypothetical protein